MNTANKLTLCRVVMIPIFIVLLYLEFAGHLWVALAVFILASVTDFVDGYVARHYDQVTDFGKFMDPLADKLLVMSAMVWFVEVGWMPAWAFFIVIARELAVTGLRLVAVEQGLAHCRRQVWKGKNCLHHGLYLLAAGHSQRDSPAGLCGGHSGDDGLLRGGVFCEEPAGYFEWEYVKAVLRRDGSAAASPFRAPARTREGEAAGGLRGGWASPLFYVLISISSCNL
ncbi:MAG: CDP-diacylglycerol--glycerol-3-phosphate 3-phosphatidyltransferase [Evtepia gabavorous]